MKNYTEWKEDFAAAPANDVPAFSDTHIGPQNRLASKVRVANDRFGKIAGDAVGNMSINQKLHYLADNIMSMIGQDPEMIGKDHQLLSKLRSMIIKIDGALKQHHS